MAKKLPEFRLSDALGAQTVLFQSLIVQLIEARVLTVEQAERVFDAAFKRAKEKAEGAGPARYVTRLHDTLPWDKLYVWSAANRKRRSSRR